LGSKKLKALYIKNQEPFPEVEQFIAKAVSRYNLQLTEYNEQIKSSVGRLLDEHPKVNIIYCCARKPVRLDNYLKSFITVYF